MDNTKTIFCASENLGFNAELQAFSNSHNEIYIEIDCDDMPVSFITLDRETAIKLVKTLKREIAKIDAEVTKYG